MLLFRSRFYSSAARQILDGSRRKRKIAMVIGFVGTGYSGLQQNPNSIETEILGALHAAGCVIESNRDNNSKIGWSRTSRTDSNVHASRLVVSGKLLIDPETIDASGRVAGLSEQLNDLLPPSIRVFSCTHVHGGFRARQKCCSREYDYFLSLSFLSQCTSHNDGMDRAIERYSDVLQMFEGSHNFQNFTRRWQQRLKRSNSTHAAKHLTRRHVYVSHCDQKVHEVAGEPVLVYNVQAQGFLLHQIRAMVGAAIAVATGHFTRDYVEAALESTHPIPMPLAPAAGLVLQSCKFWQTEHGVRFLENDASSVPGTNKQPQQMRTLLLRDEETIAEKFKLSTIYPAVREAWLTSDEVSEWAATHLNGGAENMVEENTVKQVLTEAREAAVARANLSEEQAIRRRKEVLSREKEHSYSDLLPRFFCSRLIMRYGSFASTPSLKTANVQRGLIYAILSGRVHIEARMDDLFDYIDHVGIETLEKQGMQLNTAKRCRTDIDELSKDLDDSLIQHHPTLFR